MGTAAEPNPVVRVTETECEWFDAGALVGPPSTAFSSCCYRRMPLAATRPRDYSRELICRHLEICMGLSNLLAGLADARRLAELLGHIEVVLQRRQRLAGPILQIGIIATLGL